MDQKRFLKLYAKIPEAERKFTIIIIDKNPITWEMAYKEIENNTELGKRILEKLNKQGIL